MKDKFTHIIIILLLGLVFTTSCKRVVIKLESIPSNTPHEQPIYIAGNFNNWDPGDENFQMTLDVDSNYYIALPPGFGRLQYKFTRGDWTTVEKDICGEEIGNRNVFLNDIDTLVNIVGSWGDLDPINCDRIVIQLENIPENTPEDDIIAIASNINAWDPDEVSVFKEDGMGKMYVTIDRPPGTKIFDYKMTRGDLSTSESDEFGNDLPTRTLEFGKKDTVKIDIQGWTDLPIEKSKRIVLIIKNIPENTPVNDRLFIASNLNSWRSGDQNFEFQKNKNDQFFFSFPQKKFKLDFKVTRNGWNTVEVDKNGYDIENRSINLQNTDTIFLKIDRWKDKGHPGDDDVTIVLNSIPESTPHKSNLYISGNFNNWNPGRLRHMFTKKTYGKHYITLPRKNGNIEFRITRGSKKSLEINSFGSEIPEYIYNYYDFDTLFIDVENWMDKPKQKQDIISLVINNLPPNTPKFDNLFLAPDFNNWNPYDLDLIFDKLKDGRPIITIPAKGNSMKYKITRGGWSTVEVNEDGNEISDRTLYYGFADTVYIDIIKWRDLDGNY